MTIAESSMASYGVTTGVKYQTGNGSHNEGNTEIRWSSILPQPNVEVHGALSKSDCLFEQQTCGRVTQSDPLADLP